MTAPLTNIMNGMADALWVSAFAYWVESIGGRREAEKRGIDVPAGGEDWADVAPDVPEEAHTAARALAEALENDNACDLLDLMRRAGVIATRATAPKQRYDMEQEQRLFGWYLAMMAMGTGVSWFDDHPRFEIVVPSIETSFDGEFFSWSMGRVHKNPPLSGLPDPKDWPRGGYGVQPNPPWRPDGVVSGGRFQTYYRDGRKSWSFDREVLARDWAKEIGGTVEEHAGGGFVHYLRNPATGDEWPSSEVQSLLFDTEVFSAARAKAWAKEHGFKYGSVDTTERYHRLRQFEPDGRPCRTMTLGKSGVKAIVCSSSSHRSNPVGDHVEVVRGPGRGRSGVVESETERVARVRFDQGGSGHLERSALRTRGRSRD